MRDATLQDKAGTTSLPPSHQGARNLASTNNPKEWNLVYWSIHAGTAHWCPRWSLHRRSPTSPTSTATSYWSTGLYMRERHKHTHTRHASHAQECGPQAR
jgi:hypothetical protein